MGTDETDNNQNAPHSEPDQAMALDQSEIDSLFQEFNLEADPEEEEGQAPSESPSAQDTDASVNPASIPKAPSTELPEEAPGTLDQSAIDALFQEPTPEEDSEAPGKDTGEDPSESPASDSEPLPEPDLKKAAPIEPEAVAESAAPEPLAESEEGTPQKSPEEHLDQDTLNQLFADLGYEEVAVEVEAPLPPELEDAEGVIKAKPPVLEDTPPPEAAPAETLPRPEPESPQIASADPVLEHREEALPSLLITPLAGRSLFRWIWIAGILLIGLAGAGTWLYFKLYPGAPPAAETPAVERGAIPESGPAPVPTPPAPPPPEEAPVTPREPGSPAHTLETSIAAIMELGTRLRSKRDEIEALREHYGRQNLELARTIREKVRNLQISSLPQALSDDQIKLNLQTIQRRQAYETQLQTPLAWVERGLAEVTYIHSRFSVDLELLDVIKNYDLAGHIALSQAVLARNEPTAERLSMAVNATQYQSLEDIWEEIVYISEKEGFGRDNPNFAIWQDICDGEYGRAAQLTELSPTAAQCLSERPMPDLFLNDIKTLSAELAHHLSRWQGRWLCLNGLEILDAATGRALLQWPGSRLSLNKLKVLPLAVALYLPRWSGRHLELMGLELPPPETQGELFDYLHQWQQTGGTLYLPPAVDSQYQAYTAELAPKPQKYGHGFYFEPEAETESP